DEDYIIPITWEGGTATIWTDYLGLPTSITIPAGETCVSIPIVALLDNIEEGVETIIGIYPKDVCNLGEIIIEINDMPSMEVLFDVDDIEECYDPENAFTFSPVVTDNVGSLIYVWNDGTSDFSTEPSITVNPEVTTIYTVTVMDVCGQVEQASISVIVPEDDLIPVFSVISTYCLGAVADVLPTTSDDGIIGVWSPATIDTSSFGTIVYTFTPDAGQCAVELALPITVEEEVIPTFNPINDVICQGAFLNPTMTLPTMSTNLIPGTWSPSVPNNQVTTTYIF